MDPPTVTAAFRKYMFCDRFVDIFHFLYFADNRDTPKDPDKDRLQEIHESFVKFFRPF